MHYNQVDKKQLLAALQTHLQTRLKAQLQQAKDLLAQSSGSNQAFFLKLLQTCGQAINQQLQALEAYVPTLKAHYQSAEPGALVVVSTKQLTVPVPTAPTHENIWQLLSKNTVAKRFEQVAPVRTNWWLLPEVVMPIAPGVIEFDYQGHAIQVVSGEVSGYERSTIIGLQARDFLLGVDLSGYYDERGNSTYPHITLCLIQILDVD